MTVLDNDRADGYLVLIPSLFCLLKSTSHVILVRIRIIARHVSHSFSMWKRNHCLDDSRGTNIEYQRSNFLSAVNTHHSDQATSSDEPGGNLARNSSFCNPLFVSFLQSSYRPSVGRSMPGTGYRCVTRVKSKPKVCTGKRYMVHQDFSYSGR